VKDIALASERSEEIDIEHVFLITNSLREGTGILLPTGFYGIPLLGNDIREKDQHNGAT